MKDLISGIIAVVIISACVYGCGLVMYNLGHDAATEEWRQFVIDIDAAHWVADEKTGEVKLVLK